MAIEFIGTQVVLHWYPTCVRMCAYLLFCTEHTMSYTCTYYTLECYAGSCFSRRGHQKSHYNASNGGGDTYEGMTQMTKSTVYESAQMAPLPPCGQTAFDSKDESRCLYFSYTYARAVRVHNACGLLIQHVGRKVRIRVMTTKNFPEPRRRQPKFETDHNFEPIASR